MHRDLEIVHETTVARRLATLRAARPSGGSAGAAAMWERVMADPLLPDLLAAAEQGREPRWWVEDGRIVVDPPDAGELRARPPVSPVRNLTSSRRRSPTGGRPITSSRSGPSSPGGGGLPHHLSRFIGRQRELAELARMVYDHRLVTVTGSGGAGKTRVVSELARDLSAEFDQEVWAVDLASVTDPDLLVRTVATAMGRQEGSTGFSMGSDARRRSFAELLAEALRGRRLLLILDNCEHVVEACAGLVKVLLETCPQLRVLCTSQQALDLDGERTYRLPSLSLPPRGRAVAGDDPTGFEAVQLFLDRARARRPDLRPAPEDLEAIAEVCRRLDGIPYAIELAAARIDLLTPRQILERLDDQLGLRARGGRLTPARQRTVRATIDWSHAQLSGAEQTVLRRLSVFRGGFSVEAAQEVCAFGGLDADDVLDLLGDLVGKSLIEPEERSGGIRPRLLETTRQYAEERLQEAGEAAEVRDRHLRWFLALVERAQPSFFAGIPVEWLDVLEIEHDNLRAALEPGDAAGALERLRLATLTAPFWDIRGYVSEGRTRLADALAGAAHAKPSLRSQGLRALASITLAGGDLEAAAGYAEQALTLARSHGGDRVAESSSLHLLGRTAHAQGALGRSRELLSAARDGYHAERMPAAAALVERRLAGVAHTSGDFAEARRRYGAAAGVARDTGNLWGLGYALLGLGRVDAVTNRFDDAEGRLAEALRLAHEVGTRKMAVMALLALGDAAHRRDDQDEAADRYEDMMVEMEGLEEWTSVCVGRAKMAFVSVARDDLDAARRWLADVDPHDPALRPDAAAHVVAAQARYAGAAGQPGEAARLHRRALARWARLGEHLEQLEQLEMLALLAAERDDVDRAAGLLAATTAARRTAGAPPPPVRAALLDGLAALVAREARPGTALLPLAGAVGRELALDEPLQPDG